LPNPGFDDWASEPNCYVGTLAGLSGSSLSISGLIPGAVISTGSRIFGGAKKNIPVTVVSAWTAVVNCNVTVTIAGGISVASGQCVIFTSEAPDGWTQGDVQLVATAQGNTLFAAPVVFRDASYDSDFDTAVLDGDHQTAGRVQLRGLPV